MTQIEAFQNELEREAVTTRKMLAIVPADKFDWQPHPKSMTLKSLATHVAELPSWIGYTLNSDELDFARTPYQQEDMKSNAELMAFFDSTLEGGRQNIAAGKEEDLKKTWTLRNGDIIYTSEPKYQMLRGTFSQIIHHRAQLGVYLRLLNIPIPGSYGPSADETM